MSLYFLNDSVIKKTMVGGYSEIYDILEWNDDIMSDVAEVLDKHKAKKKNVYYSNSQLENESLFEYRGKDLVLGTQWQSLVEHVSVSIEDAMGCRSKLSEEVLQVEGMSSPRVRHLLNRLCSIEDVSYLEVGSWKGSTLISASYMNKGVFIGIDNFSGFKGNRATLNDNINRFAEECSIEFIEDDCFQLDLSSLTKKIDVFFYDGRHKYEDQYNIFIKYQQVLADQFIAVIDDWNIPEVRRATWAVFNDLKFKVIFSREYFTEKNPSPESWWNGIMVAVVNKITS